MRDNHLEERPDGYWDHLDAVRPLQRHRCWVLPLWQKATAMRTTAYGHSAVCVPLFPLQWLCHRGRRPHPDGDTLVPTTVGYLRPYVLCRAWRGPWPMHSVALARALGGR